MCFLMFLWILTTSYTYISIHFFLSIPKCACIYNTLNLLSTNSDPDPVAFWSLPSAYADMTSFLYYTVFCIKTFFNQLFLCFEGEYEVTRCESSTVMWRVTAACSHWAINLHPLLFQTLSWCVQPNWHLKFHWYVTCFWYFETNSALFTITLL